MLAAGFQFWLRDSTLVAVEQVKVTGLTTKDASRVRAALVSAAHTMTTLHVDQAELEDAIAAYPVVRALHVQADFPHRLDIRVIEHRPAAIVGGMPVAGDGTILRGLPVEGRLPEIELRGKLDGDRLSDPATLHAAHVAGARPLPCGAVSSASTSARRRASSSRCATAPSSTSATPSACAPSGSPPRGSSRTPRPPARATSTCGCPGAPAAGGLPAETLAPVAPAGSADLAAPTGTAPTAPGVDPATEQLAPPATTGDGTAPTTGTPPTAQTAQPRPASARSYRFHRGWRRFAASRITLTHWLSFRATLDRR